MSLPSSLEELSYDSYYSTTGHPEGFNNTVNPLCAGISGDHSPCSTQANVYYLASEREICDLGVFHSTVDLLVTPKQWYESYRPCWTWGEDPETGMPTHVFSQPSSTFFVMLLAIFCMWIGYQYYLRWWIRDNEKGMYHLSKLLWGMAMGAWGLGAFLAGLSYEALEWHLKCTNPGESYCLAYSWLEIVYIILQCAACVCILVAVAFSCTVMTAVSFLVASVFSILVFLIYACFVGVGGLQGFSLPLSFGFCMSVGALTMVPAFFANVGTYIYLEYFYDGSLQKAENNKQVQLELIYSWIVMVVTGIAYLGYLSGGMQYTLWCSGVWFTANDVLHIGLIIWAYMIYRLRDRLEDSLYIRTVLSEALAMDPPETVGAFGSFGTSVRP